MDYTQLAQAKAEKKYGAYGTNDRFVDGMASGYIDCLNDVNGLIEAGKAAIAGKNNRFTLLRKIALLEAAIEQFEKIDP